MGFHKHGSYSFSIAVQKMSLIGGDSYVADLTSLRRHATTGAATTLDVPSVSEEYGETAQDAEGKVVVAVRRWLDRQHTPADGPLPFPRSTGSAHAESA